MKTDEILKLYDAEYARSYDDKFLSSGYWKHGSDFEIGVLAQLLAQGGKWLDVGCGTGYFLSQFPGVPRAGLDISPAMLELARTRNPDALFCRPGDMRDVASDLTGDWDVVSCLWYAYCYMDSLAEVKAAIQNLSEWTSEKGVCFIPVIEFESLAPEVTVPYCNQLVDSPVRLLGGPCFITGFTWTWTESETGKVHENLVAPHIDHMVEMLREHFSMVAVICYPPYEPGWRGRRAILATQKKGMPPTPMSRIVAELAATHRPPIERTIDDAPSAQAAPESGLSNPMSGASQTGWLRRVWRKLPPEARQLAKRVIGEG